MSLFILSLFFLLSSPIVRIDHVHVWCAARGSLPMDLCFCCLVVHSVTYMWHTGRNGSKTWMCPLPLWTIGLRHHWVAQHKGQKHRRCSSWHLWGSHISVLCMYLPIIPLWVISCVSTLWLLLFIFCLVFIVFVTSHFSNVMYKTFGGYVLHGEPIHHVKHFDFIL